MIVLVNQAGQIQKIVSSTEFEDTTGLTALEREIPADYPEVAAWDSVTLQFNRDLTILKNKKWELAKIKRQQAENSGCVTAFGRIDTDAMSIMRINSAVLAAKLAQDLNDPFEIDWTMEDNSVVTLDAGEMISLGFTAMAHVIACHERGRELRQQIFGSQTEAELNLIDLESGWPQ